MVNKKTIQVTIIFLIMLGMVVLGSTYVFADGHDTTAPKLNGISIITSTVTKPGIVKIELDLTEDDTGVKDAYVNFCRKNNSGNEMFCGFLEEGQLLFSGKNTFQIRVPSTVPSDQYYINQVNLADSAGNESSYITDSDELTLVSWGINGLVDPTPVSSSGYVTVKDEFDVAFESVVGNPNVLSSINSMTEGSAGMIRFSSSNHIAKKEWFDAIKGKNKTLVFSNDGIQWMINGKDITNETKGINLNISCEIVNAEEYGGEGNVAVLTFADNGVLPGKTRIRLKTAYLLGSGFNLYFKDGSTVTLESTDGKGFLDGTDVWSEFYVTHNSTFLLSKNVLHTHSYDKKWKSDSTKHWHVCTSTVGKCDAPKSDEASHTYGTSGNERFTCTVCGWVDETKKAEANAADEAAKKAADDKAAADGVVTKINAIGTVEYSDSSKAKIDEARQAYDSLSDEQKALVTNYDTLISAETSYAELKTAAEKEAAEKAAAEKAAAEKAEAEKAAAEKAEAEKAAAEKAEAEKAAAEKVEKITIAKPATSVKTIVKKNKVTLSWKKLGKKDKKLKSKIKSIQVQYATDKAFTKNVVTKSLGKNKTKIVLNLKKKTQYFIRVRYKGKDGVSRWSKVKRVKTK